MRIALFLATQILKLYLKSFHSTQFKNLGITDLKLSQGFYFISGANGSGKTNFLDAIYLMCMTKSFLKSADKYHVQHGSDFYRLEGQFVSDTQLQDIIIKYPLNGSKEIILNGIKYDRATDHIGKFPVVIIAPDEVYSLKSEQEERRKFLNQTLVQSDASYIHDLLAFNKLLKQRNAALKKMRKDSRIDHNLLDALDFQMVTHGIPIHNARRKLIDLLNPLINQYTEKVSEKQQSGTMIYESKVGDDYGQLLKEYREKDYFTTRTNIGIHKDQLNCQMNEQSLNDYGSQGQIKTFVVAMKLAQFNYLRKYSGCTPLVLLDDIFANY
jgi:DNA replication and repair protein RecF